MCEMRNASSLVPISVLLVDNGLPPVPPTPAFMPVLLLPLVVFIDCCPLLLELFSFRFDDTGRETVDVNEVTVEVRMVDRDDEKAVTMRPCRTKSL